MRPRFFVKAGIPWPCSTACWQIRSGNFRKPLLEPAPRRGYYEDNFNFLSKMCLSRMRQIAFDMIDTARMSGAKVVVNGSDATDHSADYLARGADYVLLGEAEWTLLELVDVLLGRSRAEARQVHGLVFADREHESITRTPSRALMKSLDLLPLPARDLVDIGRYRTAWTDVHGFFALNLVASRGCPYKCNWCAKPIYGNSFNVRSSECVAAEMLELRDRFGADYLWFADDLFGIRQDWVQELADHVERKKAIVPFKMQSRVDLMQEDTVRALQRAGCAEVWMGVESGSQRILNAMDKGTRVSQVESANERLKSAGIRSCFFLQFGYPGETWSDIEQTIGSCAKLVPTTSASPFPIRFPGLFSSTAYTNKLAQRPIGKTAKI
jgi:radical SAM superfamily enzyme YgiQ (UPF0313 family)